MCVMAKIFKCMFKQLVTFIYVCPVSSSDADYPHIVSHVMCEYVVVVESGRGAMSTVYLQ